MINPTFNNQIVPWTIPWTGEDTGFCVRHEHYLQGAPAICQKEAQGVGTPIYGSAHFQRQRGAAGTTI